MGFHQKALQSCAFYILFYQSGVPNKREYNVFTLCYFLSIMFLLDCKKEGENNNKMTFE